MVSACRLSKLPSISTKWIKQAEIAVIFNFKASSSVSNFFIRKSDNADVPGIFNI